MEYQIQQKVNNSLREPIPRKKLNCIVFEFRYKDTKNMPEPDTTPADGDG